MYDCFDETELVGFGQRPAAYPIYPKRRGQVESSRNPFGAGDQEFNPAQYERSGLAHVGPYNQARQARELDYRSNTPGGQRVEGPTLDPGRVLTNPGRFVAPQLPFGTMPRFAFGRPAEIEDSCPDPSVQRSYGQWTASPGDVVHTTPKQLLDYDYQALSQQDIADRARLSVRKALYGR